MKRIALTMCLCAGLSGGVLAEPGPTPPAKTPPPNLTPQGAQGERTLTLQEAVQLAIQTNLKVKISREKIHEAEGRIEQNLSAFLPQFRFVTSQGNRTVNLAQQGLSGANLPIPTVVGPFYTFDSRVQMVYNFLDASAGWKIKSSQMGKLIAQVDDVVQTQAVTTMACMDYVNLIGARHALEAAQADVDVADRQVKLARDQRNAGVAAGIDVTRAESQRSEQILRLNSAVDAVNRANLELARQIGVPLGENLNPTEELFKPLEELVSFEKAHQRARENRPDLILAHRQEDQAALELNVAKAGMSPTIGVAADYGLAGNTPGMNVYGTYSVGLTINVPIFDGGLTDGKVVELGSKLKQAQLNRADLEIQVEQDVRSALLKINLSKEQIKTAQTGRDLAERELKMASDRFKAGLTNSLEVTTAQASLSRARDNVVQAEVRYNLALVELSATMGSPGAIFEIYGKEPTFLHPLPPGPVSPAPGTNPPNNSSSPTPNPERRPHE